MNRRTFLKRSGLTAFLPLWPRGLFARKAVSRRRPSDADWPTKAAWKRLNDEVDGNLIPVEFPIDACIKDLDAAGCKDLIANIKNPYYIGEHPGLTQTLGWVDAWFTKPSVFAVAAKDANHVAAAIKFARENDLRLVVKGGGHSYQGTSNAADSLLVWTRHMHDVSMQEAFVPQGCGGKQPAQRAVTCGSGAIWIQAYDAVTTKAGAYVQGGGCTTVGVAGLVQSGGFGSFSKHYGTCTAGLLEAEVVTADGKIRTANACTNQDLFWALKGGGGGTFGVVTRVTLRVRQLPEYGGGASFRVKASSDDAFRLLLRYFVGFYRENLFNDHWGEQAHIGSDNVLSLRMVSLGLTTEPFLDWIARSPGAYNGRARNNSRQHARAALVGCGVEERAAPTRFRFGRAARCEREQCLVDGRCGPGGLDYLRFRIALAAGIAGRRGFAGAAGQRAVCRFPPRADRAAFQ